jgi:uncharacterized protein
MATLIAIGGLSGSGKSTLARRLAAELGVAWYRSDVERKRLFGIPETQRLGPAGYALHVTARVYRRLDDVAGAELVVGKSVIVDAVFQREPERAAIEAVAQRASADFVGLWLEASHEARRTRVDARRGDASDATPEIGDAQAARDCGVITWHRIDATGTIEDAGRCALACVGFIRPSGVLVPRFQP